MRRRTYLATALAGVALPALAGCIGDLETAVDSRTLDEVGPESTLTVQNRNGDVTVEGEERADGHLEVTKRTRWGIDLDRVGVSVEASDGSVTIAPDVPSDIDRGRVSIDVDLRVPRTVAVETVSTRNGFVDVAHVGGDPTVDTVNGDVDVRDLDGTLVAATTNGDVTVGRTAGLSELRTTNGEIDAEVHAVPSEASVRTTNGDIGIAFADGVGCELDVTLTNGEISTEGLALSGASVGGNRLEAALGGGGPTYRVGTVNGDIELTRL